MQYNGKYKPIPFRDGNKVIAQYEEYFIDSVGNKALVRYCDYINKNKDLIEKYTLNVKWLENIYEFSGEEKKEFLRAYYSASEDYEMEWYDGPLSYFFEYKNKLCLARIYGGDSKYDFFVFQLKEGSANYIERINNNIANYADFLRFVCHEGFFEEVFYVKYGLKKNDQEKVFKGEKALSLLEKDINFFLEIDYSYREKKE